MQLQDLVLYSVYLFPFKDAFNLQLTWGVIPKSLVLKVHGFFNLTTPYTLKVSVVYTGGNGCGINFLAVYSRPKELEADGCGVNSLTQTRVQVTFEENASLL